MSSLTRTLRRRMQRDRAQGTKRERLRDVLLRRKWFAKQKREEAA